MLNKLDLTTQELLVLQSEMRGKEKSLGIAYLMLLGGHLGLHRFYIGLKKTGITQLALFLLTVALYILAYITIVFSTVTGIILFSLLGVAFLALTVWVIVDLFLLPGKIREYNAALEQELLRSIAQFRRSAP